MATVLMVDDDPALLRLLTVIIKFHGMVAETAADGREALEVVQKSEPDLILLDLNMPKMDGREFFHASRQAGYLGPIVICSAFGAGAACRELGAQASINKPFDPDALIELIDRILMAS